ncbi:MAG: septum formation initiator family protein [Oscillospiraceae bacterium]
MSAVAKKRKSIILRVAVLLFAVYVVISLGKLQMELLNTRKELGTLQVTRDEKTIKVNELMRLLENGTEADFIERTARDRLGYVYADEQVFVDLSGN